MNNMGVMSANMGMTNPSNMPQIPLSTNTLDIKPAASAADNRRKLNTYIYDYFLRNDMFDLARLLYKDHEIDCLEKTSPLRKEAGAVPDAEDAQSDLANKPADLPRANIPGAVNSSFLLDWWSQFWDCWSAARTYNNSPTKQYLQHVQMRNAADRQRMMVNQQIPGNMARNMVMPNGVPMNAEMKRAMMMQSANQPQNQAQLQRLRQQQQMAQSQIQRENSVVDINGQMRPQTPNSIDQAPSPKRQRLDGSASFTGAMGQLNRGQSMGTSNPPMGNLQMNTPNGQLRQNMQNMSANNGTTQNSPGVDVNGDMTGNAVRGTIPNNINSSATGGGNALQDYQMQLMLLEQQNKKRLMMARQEQDTVGPSGMAGQGSFGAPAMSPSNSHTGPSPNPDDQMVRGTPKLPTGGVTTSGMDGNMMQNTASPAAGFDASQINTNMTNFQGLKMPGNIMGANGQMMPNQLYTNQMNAQQMEMMRQQAQAQAQAHAQAINRQANGHHWPPGHPGNMMQGMNQPTAMMTQQQQRTTNMPPPAAPTAGDNNNNSNNNSRTQPPSPQPSTAAPPTPQQGNKAAPKRKESTKGGKKAQLKKGATAPTPASEGGDQPPTPTPATTNIPGQGNMTQNIPPQADMGGHASFSGTLDGNELASYTGMDFTTNETNDVLDNFDFDSFLNGDGGDGGFNFDTTVGFNDPPLEAGD